MTVEVVLRNPLKVALSLSQLTLLWRFTEDGGDTVLSNEDDPTALVPPAALKYVSCL